MKPKHFLLSWYGITDLRAALGFEESNGPILSALLAGSYTDIVILGYTDPSKSDQNVNHEGFAAWEEWRNASLLQRGQFARHEQTAVTERVSNTSQGHQTFVDWLTSKLADAEIEVSVHFQNHVLHKLNDASGILQPQMLFVLFSTIRVKNR